MQYSTHNPKTEGTNPTPGICENDKDKSACVIPYSGKNIQQKDRMFQNTLSEKMKFRDYIKKQKILRNLPAK
jgi:hypothetical protein